MKSLQNEKGAALVYVLMIAAILVIIVPSLIMANTTSQISTDLTEKQKIVTQLAVSGMQAIVKNPIPDSQKIDYLLSNNNTINKAFQLPTGQLVTYRQFVIVHGDLTESPIISNLSLNYDVIVSATIGTQTKKIVRNINLAVGAISLVTSSPITQPPNTMQMVAVTVNTLNVANNTPVSVELVTSTGAHLSPVVSAAGTINSNLAVVSLVVPSRVTVGSYLIKATVNALTNSAAVYTISAAAPAATQATIISNGVVQNLTAAQFMTLQTITTAGTLYIPSSFVAVQPANNSPITYTAAQGIFINTAAGVTTFGINSDIVLKACSGPIVVDGAGIGTGQSNISLQAGSYISAKNTLFGTISGNVNVRLTANDYIDLTGATLYSTNIFLSAFNTVSKIITTGTNFLGTIPGKVANAGTAVTCP